MRLFKTRKTAQAGKVWKSYPFATTMACESSDENVQIQDASVSTQAPPPQLGLQGCF